MDVDTVNLGTHWFSPKRLHVTAVLLWVLFMVVPLAEGIPGFILAVGCALVTLATEYDQAWPWGALIFLPIALATARRAPWIAIVFGALAACLFAYEFLAGQLLRHPDTGWGLWLGMAVLYASCMLVLTAAVAYFRDA